jgi:3-phenylpropionate/trans-cinnamate dioxygenase ferredoxin reductase component
MTLHTAYTETVVIVGAGIAGGNTAVTLRDRGWQGAIRLLGAEPGIPFGRPPLSKTYLRGEEDLTGWYVKPGDWYSSHGIELRTGAAMQQLDTAGKRLRLTDGEIVRYDKLVLCTGGHNRRFEVPGATLPGVYQLRTVAECDAIRRAARPGARAVVAGMGFIGAEVAASLRQMELEVTVVLSGSGPLASVLGAQASDVLAAIHREHGVRLVIGDHVVGIEGNRSVERVVTGRGESLACDLVVAGIGIAPAVEALSDSGISMDNGILVDEYCQTSVPDVYAAGDVANLLHPVFGRVRVEHFNNGEKQGRAVARSLLGEREPYDYIYSFWSDQYEHNLEYVGFARSWDRTVLRGSIERRRFLIFYLVKGSIQAVFGLNRGGDPELEADSELRACQELIRGGARLAPEVLADETVDLWSLEGATRR